MNDRHGALLVFRDGVTPQQAAAALEQIRSVLDLPTETTKYQDRIVGGRMQTEAKRQPFQMIDKIQSFNPDWGWPTWYVP